MQVGVHTQVMTTALGREGLRLQEGMVAVVAIIGKIHEAVAHCGVLLALFVLIVTIGTGQRSINVKPVDRKTA